MLTTRRYSAADVEGSSAAEKPPAFRKQFTAEGVERMSQAAQESDTDDAPAPPKKKGGFNKLLIIVGAGMVLTCAGLAGAYFTGMLDPVMSLVGGTDAAGSEEFGAGSGEPTFYEMPDFVISLNNGDRKSRFMRIRVSLEVADKGDVPEIERLMPRIVDNIQVYLRELRTDDLKGSAGTHRLREELLRRINATIAPLRIGDVLFLEILLQ